MGGHILLPSDVVCGCAWAFEQCWEVLRGLPGHKEPTVRCLSFSLRGNSNSMNNESPA